MELLARLNRGFTTLTITLVAVGITLNLVLGQTVSLLNLPVFLDSLGTVVVALLAGPWVGGLTGLLTNLIWGLISNPTAAAFAPVAMIIGVVAGACARYGLFRVWWQVILSGVLMTLALSLVAIPIRVVLFGGVTGSGADLVTAYLLATGRSLFSAVIITVIGNNLVDKTVTALLAWSIVRGSPNRLRSRFAGASRVTR